MSKIALKDLTTLEEVLAEECTEADQYNTFYCVDCHVEMQLIAYNSIHRSSYFRCRKNHKHTCLNYGLSDGSSLDFDTSKFNLSSLLFNIQRTMHQTSSAQNSKSKNSSLHSNEAKPIKTPTELYTLCKNKKISDHINQNIRIQDILCDNRSQKIYCKYISGIKLVEAQFHHYSKEKLTIYANYPIHPQQDSTTLKLTITFTDKQTFNFIKNAIFDKTSHKNFCIFADWKNCHCTITTKKQVIFPKI